MTSHKCIYLGRFEAHRELVVHEGLEATVILIGVLLLPLLRDDVLHDLLVG